MAIIEAPDSAPLALPSGGTLAPHQALGVFSRPGQSKGWRSWITSVDHKRVGVMYGSAAILFFLVGGVEALLIRLQLAHANGTVLNAAQYNQVFTMHGITMIFLVVMPLGAAFMNYLMPLQVGARDVAFPRLNAFSFWAFLFGGLFLNSSWFLGGAPDGGWFAYAPNTKPIFGYPFMVASGIAIGFMGWGVWAHHMFASGVGPLSVAAFSVSTMFIAVPTGVKILNWVATMYGGRLHFTVAMKFAVALVAMFTIGGLSGVTHAVSPSDLQQTDTYYIVAHFHYVIFGGALLGFFGAMYYWWPKAFGYKLSEKFGSWHFWLTIIGMNLTFGPMHIVGL